MEPGRGGARGFEERLAARPGRRPSELARAAGCLHVGSPAYALSSFSYPDSCLLVRRQGRSQAPTAGRRIARSGGEQRPRISPKELEKVDNFLLNQVLS